jgi:hypothetical protein
MPDHMTYEQYDSSRCENCGAPLIGRFSPCASCHARPVAARGVRTVTPPGAGVPLNNSRPMPPPQLPASKTESKSWDSSSRARAKRYDAIEEAALKTSAYRRLRRPIVLGASALAVTSAVYLGFVHSNESSVGTPVSVSGVVKTQGAGKSSAVVLAVAPRPSRTTGASPATTTVTTAAATQHPANAITQRAPSLRTLPVISQAASTAPPAPMSAPSPRRVAFTSQDTRRTPGNPADKPRVDVSRHLRAARASLQENNLSATKARLAAAIAAQPDNRDARNMRASLNTREEERDALLSLARGCGYVGEWKCVSRTAGDALQIDASSKEAQHLVTLAMHESVLRITPPVEPSPVPAPDAGDPAAHP